MATLSSWTNDDRGLSAARYALRPWYDVLRPWYDVLRSTFWQRKGQPFWLGLVLCPTIGLFIIYILKQ